MIVYIFQSEEDKKHNWFWLTGEPLPFNHAKWYNAAEPGLDHGSDVEKYGLIGTAKTSLKDLMSAQNDYDWICGFLCHIH